MNDTVLSFIMMVEGAFLVIFFLFLFFIHYSHILFGTKKEDDTDQKNS